VSVDEAMLRSLGTFSDPSLGITERFEILQLSSGWTVGVLSAPLGEAQPVGWLICHSFGSEQWHLHATEVALARALAAKGFPVLRFHCQGYGDSEQTDFAPTVTSHLADTPEAAAHLRSLTGVGEIGLIGARFGAAVARLTAADVGAGYLVLVDPLVRGRRYLRQLLRSRAIVELTNDGATEESRPDDPASDLHAVLRSGGVVNVRGFAVTPSLYEAMNAIDLTQAAPWGGSALVIQVSRGPRPDPSLTELGSRLEVSGATVASTIVSGQYAAIFGDGHFRPVEGDELADALVDVNGEIADAVVRWAGERVDGPTNEGGNK